MEDNSEMNMHEDFIRKYPEREPDRSVVKNEGELKFLSTDDGMVIIDVPPARWAELSYPPKDYHEYDEHRSRYIWIIDSRGIPCIKEISEATMLFETPKAKHTNLSGGNKASLGGEAYFSSEKEIYLSGSSGRYKCTGDGQLYDAARIFKVLGYDICCLGWDGDRERPSIIYREGVAQWI